MQIKFFQSKRFFIATAAIVIVVVAGGFVYYKSISMCCVPPLSATEGGLFFEKLLPPESDIVVIFNPTDETERGKFVKIWNTIMQDKSPVVIPYLIEQSLGIGGEIPLADIDMLVDMSRGAAFALADKKFYFLFSVKNSVEALAVLERNKKMILGFGTESDKVQFGAINDIVFITDVGEEAVNKMVSRSKSRFTRSLAQDGNFKKALSYLGKTFSGYVYLGSSDAPDLPFVSRAANLSLLSFKATNEGLLFDSIARGDKQTENLAPYIASVYRKVPMGENMILFLESSNFDEMILGEAENFKKYGSEKSLIADFEENTGLKFEEDLRPFLKKGFAISLVDAENLIPALSIFIDVSGAPEKADAALKKIDDSIPGLVTLINMVIKSADQKPVAEPLAFKTIGNGGIVKIYLDRISPEVVSIPIFALINKPLEFSYGITNDNVMFFTLMPNFEDVLAEKKGMESGVIFKKLQANIVDGGATRQLMNSAFMIVDAKAIIQYLERIIEAAKATGNFSQSNKTAFEIIKKHMGPIEGYLQFSRGENGDIFSKGFLGIMAPNAL